MPCLRYPLLTIASLAALLCVANPASPSSVVRAAVQWHGRCENRGLLEAALFERGVELWRVSGTSEGGERLKLIVTAESGGDFSRPGVVATLDLEGAAGGRERRVVEVPNCDALHSAIAVILSVFAQQMRLVAVAASPATTPSASPTKPEKPMDAERRRVHEQTQSHSASTPPASRPSSRSASGAPAPHWRGGELRFGTRLSGGYGWVDTATLGPTMQFEWRPAARAWVALRAAVSYLTTLELRLPNTDVTFARRVGMLAAKLDTWLPQLHVVVGAELGDVAVSVSKLSGTSGDSGTWVSLLLMPELEVPLYDRLLFAQLGTSLAFAPIRYQIEYEDTGNQFAETRHFEWRAEVGITVQLTPAFP